MVEPTMRPNRANDTPAAEVCLHPETTIEAQYGQFTLYRCNRCHLVFSDGIGETIDPEEQYEDFYKNEIGGRFSFGIEYVVRMLRLWRAFKIFTLKPGGKSILDIGSGRGFMLYYLKKYFGYQTAIGTQISRPAVEFSRKRLGLEIYDKDLLDLPVESERYDVVTMWHVLEHLKEPEQYVRRIAQILKPDGKIMIEVPNYNSWTRKWTKQYWLGLDLDYHLHFFTHETLGNLLRKHGFKVKKTHTFSLEYSTFISVQSIVSLLTSTDQAFFQFLQGRRKVHSILPHILLFVLLAPICFLVNCLLYPTRRGEVLLIVASKS